MKIFLATAFSLALSPLGALPAHAALLDQYVLSQDPTFVSRVRTAMIAAAIAISNEGSGVTNHALRDGVVVNCLTSPDVWKNLFAATVSTDSTVIGQATQSSTVTLTTANVAAQTALVTDTAINNAISSEWNSFFAH